MTAQSEANSVTPPASTVSQTVKASGAGSLADKWKLELEELEDREAPYRASTASSAPKTSHPLSRYQVSEGDGQRLKDFVWKRWDEEQARLRFKQSRTNIIPTSKGTNYPQVWTGGGNQDSDGESV